jgi:hypothetical protein
MIKEKDEYGKPIGMRLPIDIAEEVEALANESRTSKAQIARAIFLRGWRTYKNEHFAPKTYINK